MLQHDTSETIERKGKRVGTFKCLLLDPLVVVKNNVMYHRTFVTYLISISNDGRNYDGPVTYSVYDSKCMMCSPDASVHQKVGHLICLSDCSLLYFYINRNSGGSRSHV